MALNSLLQGAGVEQDDLPSATIYFQAKIAELLTEYNSKGLAS
jgi:hypothetical protein